MDVEYGELLKFFVTAVFKICWAAECQPAVAKIARSSFPFNQFSIPSSSE